MFLSRKKFQITLVFAACSFVVSSSASAQNVDQLVKNIRSGNLQEVKKAMESGVSVDSTAGRFHESLLNLAANSGREKIVRYLIDQGAQVNKVTGVAGGDDASYSSISRVVIIKR